MQSTLCMQTHERVRRGELENGKKTTTRFTKEDRATKDKGEEEREGKEEKKG